MRFEWGGMEMPVWLLVIEYLAYAILIGLLGLSVWSVAIIIEKHRKLKKVKSQLKEGQLSEGRQDSKALEAWVENCQGLVKETLNVALKPAGQANKDRAVTAFLKEKKSELEEGLIVLGTLGSVTPFIGLFGTILGIIVAFGALSIGEIDSQGIMLVLAEALILTAAGLLVAIPAVIYYNFFNHRIREILATCENAKDRMVAAMGTQQSGH